MEGTKGRYPLRSRTSIPCEEDVEETGSTIEKRISLSKESDASRTPSSETPSKVPSGHRNKGSTRTSLTGSHSSTVLTKEVDYNMTRDLEELEREETQLRSNAQILETELEALKDELQEAEHDYQQKESWASAEYGQQLKEEMKRLKKKMKSKQMEIKILGIKMTGELQAIAGKRRVIKMAASLEKDKIIEDFEQLLSDKESSDDDYEDSVDTVTQKLTNEITRPGLTSEDYDEEIKVLNDKLCKVPPQDIEKSQQIIDMISWLEGQRTQTFGKEVQVEDKVESLVDSNQNESSVQLVRRQTERFEEFKKKHLEEVQIKEKVHLEKEESIKTQAELEKVKLVAEKAAADAATQAQKVQEATKQQQLADEVAAKTLHDKIILEEKLRNQGKGDVRSNPNPSEIPSVPMTSSIVDQIGLAIAQAIGSSVKQNNSSSDSNKFLARQTHNKELPHFSGRAEQWPEFQADFKRSTADCGWSNSDNLARLRRSLKGDAYEYVRSLLTNPDAVPTILKKLEIRYGQPDLIIATMIEKVRVIPTFHGNEFDKLIEFGSAVQNAITTIQTLKCEEYLVNPSLLIEFERKLPNQMLMQWLQWEEKKSERKRNLVNFANWLDKMTELACKARPALLTSEEKQVTFSKGKQEKQADNKRKEDKKIKKITVESLDFEDTPTAAGLAAATEKKRECIFCAMENHSSQKCFKAKRMSIDERSEAIKKKNGCFRCLKIGHISKYCKTQVTCDICGKRHETIMCFDDEREKEITTKREQQVVAQVNHPSFAISRKSNLSQHKVTMLKVVAVKVVGPRGSSTVRLLVDEGSQASYIGSRTAKKTGCRSLGVERVKNCLLGGFVTEPQDEHLREVTITNLAGTVSRTWTLREKPIVCTSLPKVPIGPWLESFRKQNVVFTDLEGTKVDEEDIEILIGSDLRGFLMSKGEVEIDEGVIARETIFGWALGGPVEACNATSMANVIISMFQKTQHSMEDLWSLELLGIKDEIQTKTKLQEEEEAKQHFLNHVTRNENGRYSVALPFVNEKPVLPSNLTIAKKRLEVTTKKLRDKKAIQMYDLIFRGWQGEGIIEIAQGDTSMTHYLPHHPVFKPDSKTTPVRPVFDASCKSLGNPSLNNCLYKGPNLIELIPAVLNRFRERRLGVVSDIRKAFQMIEVREEDRDYQRFLWWESGEKEILQVLRHTRVVFGITSSPFLLGAVLDLHLNRVQEENKNVSLKLLRSMYVDNSIVSFDTQEECEEFRRISTQVLAQAGMELREWQYTEGEISGIGFPRTSGRCGLEIEDATVDFHTPVLGLTWDRKEDTLSCDVTSIDLEAPWTKRKLLSVVARIFDPIGYTCPATLPPKMMVQEMWKSNKDWDEALEDEVVVDFVKWYQEVQQLSLIKIPRQMVYCQDPEEIQLHLFTDACSYAYAAVVFIRSIRGSEVQVQLVQARSRVAPVKGATIPRLELMGCFIGVRLLKLVRDSLDVNVKKEFCWTDSMTALAWIRRNEEWGTFVSNRVKEIRKLTSIKDWRHVAGTLNPADLPSRGCYPSQLVQSKWWEKVPWIKYPEEEWPIMSDEVNEEEVSKEIKGRKKAILHVNRKESWFSCKFSCFSKVVKVMGWILRFLANVKIRNEERKKEKVLSSCELRKAEESILRCIQEECLVPDFQALTKKLSVVQKDGLLCIKTKLLNKDDSELFRWPIILPKDHSLVKALIQDVHIAYGHPGIQFLLCKLREKYWILGGRRAVKTIIRQCPRCRRHDAKPFNVIPAALPEDRVTPTEVFQTTGVDLAGPVSLRDGSKAWIVLFTCSVFRCVHFDIVTSLSAEAFLGALERFINVYGRPRKFYSDNGTNFVGVVNMMKTLNWEKLEKEFNAKSIKWTFNPPAAPWWGGWWERLVRSMKNQLRRILGTAKLTYDELRTSLSTVQSTMNDRPLTVMTEDAGDLIPLTPAMFLHPTRSARFLEGDNLNQSGLGKAYKKMRSVQRQLQERFRSEYLAQLVQRGKEKKSSVPKVGDVVLIGSDDKKRFQWPIGVIVEIIPGRDGEVRVAKVRTAHDYVLKEKKGGKWEVVKVKKGHVWTRPLQRLYPLEISSSEDVQKLMEAGKGQEKVKNQEKEKIPIMEKLKVKVKTRFGRSVKQPSRYGEWVITICVEDYDSVYEE